MRVALFLLPFLAVPAWPAALPTPRIACDPGLPTNTTCDRETNGTTINKPTLVVASDVQTAMCYTDGTAINSLTGGATWTSRSAEIAFGAYRIELFSQVAGDAEPATYTLSTDGPTNGCVIGAWRSVSQTIPFDVVDSTTGNGTTATLPSITTSADNALVIYACLLDSGVAMTPPAGYTEETDNTNGVSLGWKILSTAGATGTATVTWTGALDYRCIHVAWNYNTAGVRFFAPSTGAPAVSPAFGAVWEDTDQGDRIAAVFNRGSTANTNHDSVEESADTTAKDHLNRQYAIQIGAQSVSGVVQCNFRTSESNAAMNGHAVVYAWLADSSGVSTSEVLLDTTGIANDTDEFGTGVQARNFPRKGDTHTMTTQTSSNNDYLIVEVGAFHNNTASNARTQTIIFGDADADELERNEVGSAGKHAWCDFPSGLAAPSAGACVPRLALMGVSPCS